MPSIKSIFLLVSKEQKSSIRRNKNCRMILQIQHTTTSQILPHCVHLLMSGKKQWKTRCVPEISNHTILKHEKNHYSYIYIYSGILTCKSPARGPCGVPLSTKQDLPELKAGTENPAWFLCRTPIGIHDFHFMQYILS